MAWLATVRKAREIVEKDNFPGVPGHCLQKFSWHERGNNSRFSIHILSKDGEHELCTATLYCAVPYSVDIESLWYYRLLYSQCRTKQELTELAGCGPLEHLHHLEKFGTLTGATRAILSDVSELRFLIGNELHSYNWRLIRALLKRTASNYSKCGYVCLNSDEQVEPASAREKNIATMITTVFDSKEEWEKICDAITTAYNNGIINGEETALVTLKDLLDTWLPEVQNFFKDDKRLMSKKLNRLKRDFETMKRG